MVTVLSCFVVLECIIAICAALYGRYQQEEAKYYERKYREYVRAYDEIAHFDAGWEARAQSAESAMNAISSKIENWKEKQKRRSKQKSES